MFKSFLLFVVFVISILSQSSSVAAELVLRGNENSYSLAEYLEFFEDKSGKLSFEEVLNRSTSGKFVPYTGRTSPNFGFTESAYWFQFKVVDQDPQNTEWLLELAYPLLDDIELYISTNKGTTFAKRIAGDSLPFSKREVKHRNFVFRIPIEKETRVLLRVATQSSMIVPLNLTKPVEFSERESTENLSLGIYYGIMLVMIIFNFVIYLTIRDKNYLYYLVFIISYTIMQSSMNGLAVEYLWPESPYWANRSLPIFIGISWVWGHLFTQSFLQTKVHTSKIHRVHTIMIFLSLLISVLSCVLPYYLSIRIATAVTLVSPILILYSGWISLRKGYRPARFFLLAWIFLLLGIFLRGLSGAGLIPSSFFSFYGLQFGSAMETILLALALVDRINILKEEKQSALQALFKAYEKGSSDERQRVARDLHDDVGAKLLSLIYQTKDQSSADKARVVMAELRSVIQGLQNSKALLSIVLISIHEEILERTNENNIQLNWSKAQHIPDKQITYREHANIQKIIREAITNIIRHAKATVIIIEIDPTERGLVFSIIDDGQGFNWDTAKRGNGLHNMRSRADELGANISWHSDLKGTRLTLAIPMNHDSQPEHSLA